VPCVALWSFSEEWAKHGPVIEDQMHGYEVQAIYFYVSWQVPRRRRGFDFSPHHDKLL